jgi:predicted Zn-dependent peptidase
MTTKTGLARSLDPARFPVIEHRLGNGLQILLLPKRNVPAVSYTTFFRVGSRNEEPGRTGMAHFLEHMMFNGAEKYGPKEFDRTLESVGGTSNAYTSHDLTVYFEDFPTEALETVIDLEADRMRALALAEDLFESEREVVKEERRYRVDNDLFGTMEETLASLMFRAHPYRWPVIGWMGDLDAATREDARRFFRTYYAPNNALLVVVGDVDPERALASIESAYREIPAGPPVPAVSDSEPEPAGERRARVDFPSHTPAVLIGYRTLPATHPDTPAVEILETALGAGDSSILMERIVYERELASDVHVSHDLRIDPSAFLVFADLPAGGDVAGVEAAIYEELERIGEEGLSEKALERAKAIVRAAILNSFASHAGIAHALGEHQVVFGDWREALTVLDRYQAVTADDVRRVAREIFREANRSVVTVVPEAA